MGNDREPRSIVHPASWRARRSGYRFIDRQYGRWGYVLAWLIGIPIPILLLVYLLRGCN
jgi:hypothetical protein